MSKNPKQKPTDAAEDRKRPREAFAIIKLGERKKWVRIGTAFVNADGSENLKLNLWPTDPATTIQIRDPLPEQAEEQPPMEETAN